MAADDMVRVSCFAGVFAVLAVAELFAPRRPLGTSKPRRWFSNLGLVAVNTLVVRFAVPGGAAGMAVLAQSEGWGWFNQVELPAWLVIVLSLVLLDFAIFLQHVLFHALPFLWRLHRVHHADLDFDVTTGLRFHTLEILISLGIKLAVIGLI